MRIAVVIPAHNEAPTIADIAARARRQLDLVIVVDDGSTDGTREVLRDLPVTVLRNDANQGKAASLWRGMAFALEQGATAVISMDGDGQHRPEDIPRLLTAAHERPGFMVIGARLCGRSQVPRLRRFANRFADFWISWAAGYPIADSQSGFRLYPRELLMQLRLSHAPARGFVWENEVLIEAARAGVFSVPVAIDSIYDDSRRPSHYRPVIDTARIVRMVAWKLISRGFYPLGLLRALQILPSVNVQSRRARAYSDVKPHIEGKR